MPSTVNGIGTHYYGAKYKRTRQAVCQLCGRPASLSTYETRLWFVVFFLPIIPLQRRRILDQCSVCQRHYAVPVRAWETGRRTDPAVAIERFRREKSEEAALDVHGQLVEYLEMDHAEAFRREMLEEFPKGVLLRAGFASQLEYRGVLKEAAKLWDEAYKLQPDHPEVRIGMARRKMQEQEFDEARELLRFLEEPGAEQQYNMDPLFDLAGHYQQAARHEQTLEVMEVLLKAYPDAARGHQVRAFVKTSEKALGRKTSILPDVEHSVTQLFSTQYSSGHRWAVGIAVALILAALGAFINNEYIRRHRTLTIINAWATPAIVSIDGSEPLHVTGRQTLTVGEGNHRVRISGPVDESYDIAMESSFWDRWTKAPVWIINVGGAGIVADMTVYYARPARQPAVRLTTEPVIVRPDVDHAFEAPPDTLEVSSRNQVRTLRTIQWIQIGEAADADLQGFYLLLENDRNEAWNYATRRLQQDPSNERLARALATESNAETHTRLQKLLETGLDYRPVNTQWHRAYQDLPSVSFEYERLVNLYDEMLNVDPENAQLLYLRGRIEKDPQLAAEYRTRSAAADPGFSWNWYSSAYHDVGHEAWESCLNNVARAHQTGLPSNETVHLRQVAMLALGRQEELAQLLRDELNESPGNMTLATLLAECLIVSGDSESATQAIDAASASFRQVTGRTDHESLWVARAMLAYYQDDLKSFLNLAGRIEGMQPLVEIVQSEDHLIDTVEQKFEFTQDRNRMLLPLILSLAWHQRGDTAKRDEWYQKQIEQFRKLGPRYQFLESILSSPEISSDLIARTRNISDSPFTSALIFTSLALRTSDETLQQQFLTAARNVMIRRAPPYHLLRRILTAAESEQ